MGDDALSHAVSRAACASSPACEAGGRGRRDRSPNGCTTSGGDFNDAGLFQQRVGSGSQEIDSEAASLFYLAIPPGAYAHGHRAARRGGLVDGGTPERQWRRVIVEKPFGTDLASARELNQIVHQHFDEDAGLPHRSLSRQGDRAESDGVPVRQRDVRADLEPPLHRSRADHRRRDRRRRAARARITKAPARCATWCRTT